MLCASAWAAYRTEVALATQVFAYSAEEAANAQAAESKEAAKPKAE
jgi:hypothetical protein